MLTELIAQILKGLYSQKTKQLVSNIEVTSKELRQKFLKLQKLKEENSKERENPETIAVFKKIGIDIIDWPRWDKNGRSYIRSEKNLLFKKSDKKLIKFG